MILKIKIAAPALLLFSALILQGQSVNSAKVLLVNGVPELLINGSPVGSATVP